MFLNTLEGIIVLIKVVLSSPSDDIIQDMSDVADLSHQTLEMLTTLNDKIKRVRSVTSMIEGISRSIYAR